MAPNVHALVVEHKQAPENLLGSVEIDTVPVSDLIIVLHEAGRGLVVANEVPFFIILSAFSSFFLGGFLSDLFLFRVFLHKCCL